MRKRNIEKPCTYAICYGAGQKYLKTKYFNMTSRRYKKLCKKITSVPSKIIYSS